MQADAVISHNTVPTSILKVSTLFVDFYKAFDMTENGILLNKFVSSGLPEHVTVWSLDFLNDHKLFVKIGESSMILYLVCRPVCKMVLGEFLSGIEFVGP